MVNIDPTILQLILLWCGYFVLHSLLASQQLKAFVNQKLPGVFPCYRLIYNLIALITLTPIAFIHFQDNSNLILRWPEWTDTLTTTASLAALAGFIWSLKYYDMSIFFGIRNCWRNNGTRLKEGLNISPMHRLIRHPWYLFAIIIIWSRDQSSIQLSSSIMITLYFFIGARLEEKKLRREYGQSYEQYMRHVPGIIPRPWKWLSTDQVRQILGSEKTNGA